MLDAPVLDSTERVVNLDFLWLELTNRCNLQCVHCYSESGPDIDQNEGMNPGDYQRVLREAAGAGCRKVQFIGGEPTLNHALPGLIAYARREGFAFVEIFSNLVSLPKEVFKALIIHDVDVATSFYGPTPEIHDTVTLLPGSFYKTVQNMKQVLAAGLRLRVGIISMPQNLEYIEETKSFLSGLGVEHIRVDRLRGFGRGDHLAAGMSDMAELCGNCSSGTMCVGPDGVVSPCIMSKPWSVGSVLNSSLCDIAGSDALSKIRDDIALATTDMQAIAACNPDRPYPCSPDQGRPCAPSPCNPNSHCGPNACRPVG